MLQVWYRRIKDESANSSLDVDFYFPVDQWLVAREDYHRCTILCLKPSLHRDREAASENLITALLSLARP